LDPACLFFSSAQFVLETATNLRYQPSRHMIQNKMQIFALGNL
jgi:hypothetical protein